jgi:hypothetical protein
VTSIPQWLSRRSAPITLSLPSPPQRDMFDEIQSFARSGAVSIEMCVAWLKHAGLAVDYLALPSRSTPCEDEARDHLQNDKPVYRCVRKGAAEICELRKRYRPKGTMHSGDVRARINAIWYEFQNARTVVSKLGGDCVPAEATACYLPFHIWGEKWGIYISLPRLLYYVEQAAKSYRAQSCVLGDPQILMQCMLFEVFHHEYFHHIVESSAATLEILVAAFGRPQPLYFSYRQHAYESSLGMHAHKPLEEALANAYAYDALAPIAHSKLGSRSVEATLYRELLREAWPYGGAGYREAGQYVSTDGDRAAFVSGTAQLAAMLLNSASVSVPALALLAKRVMPNSRTAFCSKSEIPVYLIGPDAAPDFVLAMIPAPRETCMSLFSPRHTRELDDGLRRIDWSEPRRRSASARRA